MCRIEWINSEKTVGFTSFPYNFFIFVITFNYIVFVMDKHSYHMNNIDSYDNYVS